MKTNPPSSGHQQLIVFKVAPYTFCAPALSVERPTMPPSPADTPAAESTGGMIVHRVVPGDTLWDIAGHYRGDPFQYPEPARLSRIHDPDLIYPGDSVRIAPRR